jgi:hypothetical protein
MTTSLRITDIGTARFQSVHGKKPQPTQYGFWFYELVFSDGSTVQTSFYGTFVETRKLAMRRARISDRLAVRITVLP